MGEGVEGDARDKVVGQLGVSRETADRLDCYVALLLRWQRSLNLIGPSTVDSVWTRHILDCGQLFRLIPPSAVRLLDIGSGAGLPGVIIAILADSYQRESEIHLVEADRRKAAFLGEAIRVTDVRATIHKCRIESLPPANAEVVMARALAPLPRLMHLVTPHLAPNGVMLLPKGQNVEDELTETTNIWDIDVTKYSSTTDPDGVILGISHPRRREDRNADHRR